MENPPVYSYKLQFTESTAFARCLISGVLRDGGVLRKSNGLSRPLSSLPLCTLDTVSSNTVFTN